MTELCEKGHFKTVSSFLHTFIYNRVLQQMLRGRLHLCFIILTSFFFTMQNDFVHGLSTTDTLSSY